MSSARTKRRHEDAEEGLLALLDESGKQVMTVPMEVADSVRAMVARLRLADGTDLPRRLGVTSAIAGEGVTTFTRTLALVLTNDLGRRVCVVDFNFWDPFEWSQDSDVHGGIAALVAGGAPLDAVLLQTGNADLQLLPAGATSIGERPLLANSPELEVLLYELEERFDHVIIDLPAVLATSESLMLAERAGSVVLVVHQGVTPETQIHEAMDQLTGVMVLGAVLNRARSRVPELVRRHVPGT